MLGEQILLETSEVDALSMRGNPDGHPNQTGFTMGRRPRREGEEGGRKKEEAS